VLKDLGREEVMGGGSGFGTRAQPVAEQAQATEPVVMPAWCQAALSAKAQAARGESTRDEEQALLHRTGAALIADPQRFGSVFYRRLFERMPDLRSLFPADLQAQQLKLAGMLGYLLTSLDQPDALARRLGELGQRHRGYGAKFVHYLVVGEALIETLAEINGPGFDAQARLAWARLYSWVVYRMRDGVDAARAASNQGEAAAPIAAAG
jgi:hemoglobin-like flavoprotein